VLLLAEQVDRVLDEVRRIAPEAVPTAVPVISDLDPLELPIEEDFRVATLALGWDPRVDRLVIVAQAPGEDGEAGSAPAIEEEDTDLDGPDVLRVRLTAEMARDFARRAASVVSAGRPPCPFCGLPVDAGGHICPRQNGHRR
jgi:uncharacterized repeat protein (TIGR03847 family)